MPLRSKPPATLFGRRLREARLRSGLPQDKLGVAIGLDEGSASARISRYETGIHEPPLGISNRLAQALDVLPPFFHCEDDDLAAVILAWGALSPVGKQRIRELVDMLSARVPD